MQQGRLDKCRFLQFPKITDPRGNLTFIEGNTQIPFEIKRVFYIYDVPTDISRGAHANYELKEVLICLSGSFDVCLDDGFNKKIVHLNRPWQGLFIPQLIWKSMKKFDPGTVYLVLASNSYDPSSYIRDYDSFLKVVRSGHS